MATDTTPILPSLRAMKAGDHYCGIVRSDAEQQRIVTDFVRLGIERNERMLYIVNLLTAAQLKSMLSEAGIDAEALVAKGQLVILTAKESYLKEGAFDPHKMIVLLKEETDAAIAAGYTALRTTGEMTWALAGDPGSERLLEYEALLNAFYATKAPTYAVCQYDQRRFDAETLLDVLHTHPKVLLGTEGFDNSNMYYVDDFLYADRSHAKLTSWLSNLSSKSEQQPS